MNQHTDSTFVRSTLARALGVTGFALIVAACAVPVGAEDTGESAQALPVGCPGDMPYVKCGGSGGFKSTGFEEALSALGCRNKVFTDGDGQGTGTFQALCPRGAVATFPCGATVATGDLNKLVACSAGIPGLDPGTYGSSMCGCSSSAPPGYVYAFWDPTCAGSRCIITIDNL